MGGGGARGRERKEADGGREKENKYERERKKNGGREIRGKPVCPFPMFPYVLSGSQAER